MPGLDVRGEGGFIVVAPSPHISGERYRWDETSAPLAELPTWLREPERAPTAPRVTPMAGLDRRQRYAEAALAGECAKIAGTAEGDRNAQLVRSAFSVGTLVGAGVLDEDRAREELVRAARGVGLPVSEAEDTITSGLGAGIERPRQFVDPETGERLRSSLEASRSPRASVAPARGVGLGPS